MIFTPEKVATAKEFLAELYANGGLVVHACKKLKLERRTVYNWRNRDPVFAAQWDEVIDLCVEAAEAECRRRAVEGFDEPVYHKGEMIDKVRKFSDTLLIFFLKAHRPDKYREQIKITVGDANELIDEAITQHALPAPTSNLLDSAM